MIDAHVHFWKYDPVRDSWIGDNMEVLQRDFLPVDFVRLADKNGVKGVVAVQADQSETETSFLCMLADNYPLIKGVVGWVDLCAKDVEYKLDHYARNRIIKGFRHILQGEESSFMLQPAFVNGVKKLDTFNFTYDILVYHNQLPQVIQLLDKLPDQKLIVDHCAKPSIVSGGIKDWEKDIRVIASHPNVYCKISGLVTEARWHQWKKEDFFPYIDVIVDSFGTDRIVFGSDWPVIYTSADYGKWVSVLKDYLQHFSQAEQEAFFSENVIRFYGL